MTFSAPCTVFDVTVGALMAHPERWQIAMSAMREACALAQVLDINLGFDDPEAYVTAFGARMPMPATRCCWTTWRTARQN